MHDDCSGTNVPVREPSNANNGSRWNGGPMNYLASFPVRRTTGSCPVTDTSGETVRRRDIPGFCLTEKVYPKGLSLSRHCHSNAYLSFVLSGTYREKYSQEECLCREGALRFLPPGETHENEYSTGARCLLVKIEPATLERLGEQAPVLSRPGEVPGQASAWLANRMFREFRAQDDVAPLAIEGILLEILAESARAADPKASLQAPAWLRRVREALEDAYLSAPSLHQLAAIGGVHPVHLSREFRKHYRSTIGEHIRTRRVEHAAHLLSNSGTPISEIASICGFADQSHFSAVFKKHTGLSPAKYRDAATKI